MPISETYPKIRPIEVVPMHQQDGTDMLLVHDPTGLAGKAISISSATLFIMMLLDGQHSLDDIRKIFAENAGQELPRDQLELLIEQLDAAHYLQSESFANYLQSRIDDYRSAPARVSGNTTLLGTGNDGLGPTIERMLAECEVSLAGTQHKQLAGLIAPHLDFDRGKPCYADAYAVLAVTKPAKRFVILGTNHFGQASSIVATGKDFQTPLGTTRNDRTFLEALEERLGTDLCEHEFDHQAEHSVELQVLILQHIYGPEHFEIVPILCPDPCGPTGTAPSDGDGVDLRVFGEALGELIRADDSPTVVIAGADLSHVGQRFGDEQELDEDFLRKVERDDREAIDVIISGHHDLFVETLTRRENRTRICSAGCIYALMAALPQCKPELLRYHQAIDQASGTCVTCSAMAIWEA